VHFEQHGTVHSTIFKILNELNRLIATGTVLFTSCNNLVNLLHTLRLSSAEETQSHSSFKDEEMSQNLLGKLQTGFEIILRCLLY
jgi:hypothetical protein